MNLSVIPLICLLVYGIHEVSSDSFDFLKYFDIAENEIPTDELYVPEYKNINVCKMPLEIGQCKAAFPRWYFNTETKECHKFIYGGCRGNGNNFATKSECIETCSKK